MWSWLTLGSCASCFPPTLSAKTCNSLLKIITAIFIECLLYTRQPDEVSTVIIPILWMRKLRLTIGAKLFPWVTELVNWWRWDLSPGFELRVETLVCWNTLRLRNWVCLFVALQIDIEANELLSARNKEERKERTKKKKEQRKKWIAPILYFSWKQQNWKNRFLTCYESICLSSSLYISKFLIRMSKMRCLNKNMQSFITKRNKVYPE